MPSDIPEGQHLCGSTVNALAPNVEVFRFAPKRAFPFFQKVRNCTDERDPHR